ncbi:putative arabinose 5-phosphate isomerase [Artemisia annua]|uniref:Putative arabinose 5-phosphate isomerase n=1 Tax=Artemisia annua TaxID=35608 RepID=A0A2U1P9Y6_ARTAN|nr:putative arabinose 5-phosphate isomerase [Artemisia annua]
MAVEEMKKMEAPPSPVQFLPVVNEHNIVIGNTTWTGLSWPFKLLPISWPFKLLPIIHSCYVSTV